MSEEVTVPLFSLSLSDPVIDLDIVSVTTSPASVHSSVHSAIKDELYSLLEQHENLKDEIIERKLQIDVIEKRIRQLNKDVKTPTNPVNAAMHLEVTLHGETTKRQLHNDREGV
jgi:hypothetical protein